MKKTILFTILSIVFYTYVLSQQCLPNGIIFATQSEIDNFQINYPNYTEIEGDVWMVFMINSFPAGDWIFEQDLITINSANVVCDFKGLCVGDVNASHIVP